MKIKLGAVIPTVQYGNLQPEFEVEENDPVTAVAALEELIQALWDKYGEKPLVSKINGKRLAAFVGGEIEYDEASHIYSWNSEIYLSGSQYAKSFEKPFDGVEIAKKMADKYKVQAEDISNMWNLKARTSREFGIALHSALELYGRYGELAKSIERDTAMHDHPVIKSAVESFYKGREKEKAEYEIVVVDHKTKWAGQIDRLLVTGDKECQVQDFKCNAVMTPDKLKIYWKQLEFYGEIMEAAGWKVAPPQIFHYDGTWKIFNKESE